MRKYVRRLLSSQGYAVESVADGQAALARAQANPPDIVLTDVMMPRLDGFGLMKALRADVRTRAIPIIMLSARAGEEARVEGLGAGADDYLIKPFSARELLARVRSQLGLVRLRRENEERVSGILGSITDGFQTIGADYRFTYFNEAARRIFLEQGMNPDELIGRHIFDEVFPAERDKPWALALRRTMVERVPTEVETFYEPWQRWFTARYYPAPDGGISVFFLDITDRKCAEKALLQARERFDLVRDSAQVGFWFCDLPFDKLSWDNRVKEHFWLSADAEVTIAMFYERLHPDDRDRTRRAIEESIATKARYDIEYRTVASLNGKEKWIRAIGRTFYDAQNHPIRFDGVTLDISERKRAEEALRESDARFRHLADIAPAMFWVTEPDGSCSFLSHGWYEFTGQTEQEGLGQSGFGWLNAVHPDDREQAGRIFLAANKARRPFSLDYRLRRHDGEYRWAIDAGRPRFGPNGEFLGYIGSVLDITDRVAAEEALRTSEQETKRARDYAEATLRTSPVPLLVLEQDLCVNTANEAFYDSFQVNSAETQGRLVYELGNGQWNIPKLRELLETILPHHTVLTGFEVTHDFESIGRRTMLLNARRMENEPDIPDRIVLVIEDITERRQAEEALRESEERYRTLFDAMDEGYCIIEVLFDDQQQPIDYRFIEVNGSFEQQAGMHDVVGKRMLEFVPTIEPHWLHNYGQVARTGESIRFSGEYKGLHRFFDVYAFRAVGWPEHHVAVLFADVTQRKQAEHRLYQLNDELEARVENRTRDLEHSQNRLRAMATELNLAEQRERKRLATELHDHLQQTLVLGRLLVSQGKRVAATVPACLDVLKKMDDIFTEALTYTRTLVADLSPPVLRDHGLLAGLKWLGECMKKHQITVTVIVPEKDNLNLPEDQAILLFQSVRELLINSSKHAGTGQADVRLKRDDRQLRIEVRDQGAGFDPATAADGTPSGGISSKFGLFSIQERMRALGGSFELESAPGKGTIATLVLPLLRRTEEEEHAESSGTVRKRQSKHFALKKNAPIRVLLVDDHLMMRQGLRSIVTAYDHLEIAGEAGDGAEAVELAQRLEPDVVVMDINMPNMDGIEATRQIKANQPTIVVIGLSVNQSADTEKKMKAAGAFAYLTKEGAVDALCHAIEEAVSYTQPTATRSVNR